ncbi:mycothiol system anti-sigma-R factor, partial [Salmonella enterica subsp. enterica serovar Typhimurium]|nr:mycothiol system anti-sigma-R factor [Salmonella enterica subsp. enterica serovar Typhimurium]
AAVSRALKRCNRTVAAPMQLRSRLVQMHVTYRWQA